MSSIQEALSVAIENHQAGRLEAAEQVYRQILAAQPMHADALHLLGVISSQRRQYQVAVDLISRAIELNPADGGYYINYGNALLSLGRIDEAAKAYSAAIQLTPELAEAHLSLGNAHQAQGRLSEAIAAYRQAVKLQPRLPQAVNNLGTALRNQGDLEGALECYERAVELMPNFAEAHTNLGNVRFEKGHVDKAIESFRRALRLNPQLATIHNNLGNALLQQEKFEEATASFRRAIELEPKYAMAYSNLGMAYKAQYLHDEAEACYRRALTLEPNLVEAHSNLGNLLAAMGNFGEATQSYTRALAIDPEYGEAHFSQAFLMLQRGDWEHGWQEYEWRWKTRDLRSQALPGTTWRGEQCGTILLHTDQGLGDTLQFIRFAALVKQRVNRVTLRCPTRLIPLLQSYDGIDEIVSAELPPPVCDAEAYLTSLPGPLGITLENLPRAVPYLRADERLVEKWRAKLPNGKLNIGIAWQGSPIFKLDRTRSIPLAAFAPLAEVPGAELISLQKGFGAEQIAAIRDRLNVFDCGPELDDSTGVMMDTAAIMMHLNLVITSDTSIAHLAGALGIPVWVAISFVAEWRWLLGRSDSPWYPTMRLFRQKRPRDWAGVFEEMQMALKNHRS